MYTVYGDVGVCTLYVVMLVCVHSMVGDVGVCTLYGDIGVCTLRYSDGWCVYTKMSCLSKLDTFMDCFNC